MMGDDESRFQLVPISNFPDILTKVPCILGIDEAGRGPVLGPLVYSIFVCPLKYESRLKELGVADSKVLDADTRENFANKVNRELKDQMGWCLSIVTPQFISHSMLKPQKYNLNALSYDTVYSLLQRIREVGVNVHHIYVDTLGKPEAYKKQLNERFPRYEFTVSSKADSIYPVVGAASIFAKVMRDWNLENWQSKSPKGVPFDRNFGSGYPSDPNTVSWLDRNLNLVFGFPEIVRFSWSSCARILEDRAVKINWNDRGGPGDEEAPSSLKSLGKKRTHQQATLTTFTASKAQSKIKTLHSLFRLKSVEEF